MPGPERDPEKGPGIAIGGHTHFRVKTDLEFGKLSLDLTNNGVKLTQLWLIFSNQVDRFPGHCWP